MKSFPCFNFKSFLISSLLISSVTLSGANIIFDVGGVLLDMKLKSIIKEVGVRKFLKYIITFHNPFKIRKKLFSTLSKIKASENKFCAYDAKGNKLPNIMCDWMKYDKKYDDEIITQIKKPSRKSPVFFSNNAERELILRLIKVIFSPRSVARSARLYQESLQFIKECKRQGHTIFILSNFNAQSFQFIKKKFPELFNLFDEDKIIISGNIGLIKPDPAIYKYILEKHNLNPHNCLFFDDQVININAAKKIGIYGAHCHKPSYSFMKQKLDEFTRSERITNKVYQSS